MRTLRSSELLRDQTPKWIFLPETVLISPVQNLGVHQKFTFPNDRDLLRDSSPLNFSGTFDSSLIYNQLGLGFWLAHF
jgi:hypothetical protein